MRLWCTGLIASLGCINSPALALDLIDRLSLSGTLAGAVQCQSLKSGIPSDACRGAAPFQPQVTFNPTQVDSFAVELGFAVGNGLDPVTPFELLPWAADLADDVVDINGRDRSYLLTAWYRHTFKVWQDTTIAVTAGIIDATDYVDDNAYASDEYRQFMNDAFDNAPGTYVPSYDWGGALEWETGPWSVTFVAMNVGDDQDGSFNFFGGELAYALDTTFGRGNYRIFIGGTGQGFFDTAEQTGRPLPEILLSFDQQVGEYFGAFIRIGWQAGGVATDSTAIYSGGINLLGSAWGRPLDNIGLAYAYLDGGNGGLQHADVAEIYYRFALTNRTALTADLQYMNEDDEVEGDPEGFIYGLRATVGF